MPSHTRARGFLAFCLIPSLLLFALFVLVPIVWSIYYGFFSWKGIGAAKFIGLDNYKEVLHDPVFWGALKNNAIVICASLFGQVPIALFLALLLSKSNMFQRFVRSAVFMPMVLSSVVVGLIWGYIYQPQIGIFNLVLDYLGLGSLKKEWLADPKFAIYSISLPIVWNYIGPYLVMFIGALKNIPGEIDDAVKIDGPGPFRKLFAVKLPLIWDIIKVAVVLCISGSLKSFDLVYVMTGGGPAHSTELLATYMYNNTFSIYRYGYGSAISATILIISLVLVAGSQFLMKGKSR